ncbi:glycosyl hydrolase [Rhizomicrobium electricum]|uniref:Glycosyl hydrolase n=1 Tax=Rhizomicrobium electricum TaxID=480070 RepID=A0ABN1EAV5_9PROT|nr:glycosyl hydrolase [Rhizomicrobium electricum]NIJ48051.1 hypothetical protein [Rhizomicrobium electricum]
MPSISGKRLFVLALLTSAAVFLPASGGKKPVRPSDALASGFIAPPQAARPRVFWPWMNGNVTREGIDKDLAWMHRIGIVGFPAVDAAIDTPTVVDHRVPYLSDEWKSIYRYAVRAADKYGMEVAIEGAPGWSTTGGPWVTPDQAMKKLVWSATAVEGGKPFHGVLPQPPDTIGPIQNAPLAGDDVPTPKTAALRFYRDSLVLAYPVPVESPAVIDVEWNGGRLDPKQLADGDLANAVKLTAATPDADIWIAGKFQRPATIQGVTLGMNVAKSLGYRVTVEASDDGETWRHVADFPPAAQLQRMQMGEQTISFAPVTARRFRVVLKPAAPLLRSYRPTTDAAPGYLPPGSVSQTSANPTIGGDAPVERIYQITEFVFHTAATVHEFEKKAMFAAPPRDFYALASASAFVPGSAIDPAGVVNLTDKMKPDGTLDWTPPPGKWTVLRLGYSLVGKENHPAPREATGLEVDKLNAEHVRDYLRQYFSLYSNAAGPDLFGKRGIRSILIDSSEVGQQNWTENLIADFKRLRGYGPTPFLPVLTGAAVESPAASDKFLWDFRRTVEELLAANHYGEIVRFAHEQGLQAEGEALEIYRPTFGDDMEMRRHFDMPMGAMWTYDTDEFPAQLTYEADLLGAASVAHIYGQNLVGAESLTSDRQPWAWAPSGLKRYVDMAFARGVNRMFIHTSVHQPVDKAPGLTLSGYGQMFDRLESWAGMARPWTDYIARASYLLQQGRFAADVAYFYGQEAPLTSLFGEKRVIEVPSGYAFDFFNSEALNELTVDHGALVTKSGMRYRVLYLGGMSQHLTVSVLKKLRALADAGAVIVGTRPISSPSHADMPEAFAAACDALFASRQVFTTLPEAFAAMDLKPDFAVRGTDAMVLHVHRKLADGDLYFVATRSKTPENFTATFRVSGRVPELWDAVTGKVSPVSWTAKDGRTDVTLSLPSDGSAFVVFRKPTKMHGQALRVPTETAVAKIDGAWTVAFQPGRGAPASVTLDRLAPWNESADPGVKYFSGEGTYTKTFTMPGKRKGVRYVLDLGDVKELAEVRLNGKSVGTAWAAPFKIDVTKAIRPGRNVLNVKVANLWVNRLIGDAQPDAKQKYTFTIIPTYRADAPLRPSGLIGPVRIDRVQ